MRLQALHLPKAAAGPSAGLASSSAQALAGAGAYESWTAFWRSRLLIWLIGSVAFLVLGTASGAVHLFDTGHLSSSFGRFGNVLAAPAVRWDSIWYLQIAHDGYRTARETAFYPLYPLLIRVGSLLTGSLVVAGVMISLACTLIGLELVRRLTALELGPRAAGATVQLIAFGPMALFLSAVYTESLFLVLSAATLYLARQERWALAGLLGGLAAMTRVSGVVLIVPVVLMFFYGPRIEPARSVGSAWMPRHRFAPAVLWAALIPAGAVAFAAYLAVRGFGAGATLHAQQQFSSHELVGPAVGIWDGLKSAWHELRLEISGVAPQTNSSQALLQVGVLVLAGVGVVGVLRRLPIAYAAYVITGLLIPLSSPTVGDPLRGLDRYASVLFPLYMWAGAWALERRALRSLLLISGVLLAYFTVQFATWHWVGASAI